MIRKIIDLMGTIQLLLVLNFFPLQAVGQVVANENDLTTKTFNYLLQVEAAIWECDIEGHKLKPNSPPEVAPPGSKITLIGKKGENLIIRFWLWPEGTEKYKKFNSPNRRFFLITEDDFSTKAIKRFTRWKRTFTAGTVIIPVKMRFNQFDFTKDFTIGPTFGAKWRTSRYSSNFLNTVLGFGITSVTLDSPSTNGTISGTSERSALTPSFGLVFEFNSAQVGIFTGIDYLSKREVIDWDYDKKPWLSIGLGFSILSKPGGKEETTGNQ